MNLVYKILYYTFIVSAAINFIFLLFFYLKIPFWKKKRQRKNKELPPVSVIITARNEARNLETNLPYFLQQDYPDYTVIVVNDASEDDSATVLAQLKMEYENLYVTSLPPDNIYKHGKKTALTIGIKAAKTDILLFSDADCKPISDKWIRSMVKYFDKKTQFVIGYGGYQREKSLLNKIIRTDTVYIAMQYLSFALTGIPYMGVGRNMAYRKSTFNRTGGFAKHLHLLSGSDDLFINQNAKRKNLQINLEPESIIKSIPKRKLKDWIRQKSRHLTTAKYYKFSHKILLFLEPLSRIIFYASAIFLLIQNRYFIPVLSIFVLRFIIFLVILIYTNKTLKEKRLLIMELLFDIFQPFLNLFFYLKANEKNETIWR
jgi:cellulose synthase/poly-beta-1,6-N-acetylglucosamine synthase-like glycosyltransferase